jgi:hypothetical protein
MKGTSAPYCSATLFISDVRKQRLADKILKIFARDAFRDALCRDDAKDDRFFHIYTIAYRPQKERLIAPVLLQ